LRCRLSRGTAHGNRACLNIATTFVVVVAIAAVVAVVVTKHLWDPQVGINQELKLQNKMLNDLDRDVDEAAEKMNFVMGKVRVGCLGDA